MACMVVIVRVLNGSKGLFSLCFRECIDGGQFVLPSGIWAVG